MCSLMASCSGFTHFSGVRAAAGTSYRDAAPAVLDYRRVLGVGLSASKCEVKAAYRKLALRYHPDVCRGDECEVSFMEVNRAYECLMALQSSQPGYGGDESATSYYGFEAGQGARGAKNVDDDPWAEFLQSLVNGTHEELREDYSSYYSNLRCYGSKAKRPYSGSSQYYQGNW